MVALAGGNGQLDWMTLHAEAGQVLLLSRYAVDYRPFNTVGKCDWEHSRLRRWLNGEYAQACFTQEQRAALIPMDTGIPGQPLRDKVFLLTIGELEACLPNSSHRICVSENGSACSWWLRSPGGVTSRASAVNRHGFRIDAVPSLNQGVRPAILVPLSAIRQ